MAKTPVYHLDECETCAHRHVCKHLDKIDKLLKSGSLPLDLRGASCNEFIPEDVIDEDWKEYAQPDYIEDEPEGLPFVGLKDALKSHFELDPVYFMNALNQTIGDVTERGANITGIYFNQETMNVLRQYFQADKDLAYLVLTNNSRVNLYIDNELETGIFAVQLEGGNYGT